MSNIEITPELLANIKDKAEKAISGPWILEKLSGQGTAVHVKQEMVAENGALAASYVRENCAEYIAAANPAVILDLIEGYEGKKQALYGMFLLVDQLKSCLNLEADVSVERTIQGAISRINNLNAQLSKEANWLADKLADHDCPHGCPSKNAPDLEECRDCWLNAAKKAVKE